MKTVEPNSYFQFENSGGHVRFDNGDGQRTGTTDLDVVEVLIARAMVRFEATGLEEDGNVLWQFRGIKNLMRVRNGEKVEEVTGQTAMSVLNNAWANVRQESGVDGEKAPVDGERKED